MQIADLEKIRHGALSASICGCLQAVSSAVAIIVLASTAAGAMSGAKLIAFEAASLTADNSVPVAVDLLGLQPGAQLGDYLLAQIGDASVATSDRSPVSESGPVLTSAMSNVQGSSTDAQHAFQATTDVLTYHNDNARTGLNQSEQILTVSSVSSSVFGKLFELPVDGLVDAQPLIKTQVSIPGKGVHNVLYVVTEHDSVYAFDADNGSMLWAAPVSVLGAGEVPSDIRSCGQVSPEIGITSTPVIDPSTGANGTIYVVAMSKSKDATPNYFQRIHALDITTGAEEFGGPVTITATFPSINGQVSFVPANYKDRAGLLLLNHVVYTTWASHCDIPPYTGWIISFAVNANTLVQTSLLNITPNGSEGAIWQAGAGPAADSLDNIYFLDGNGTFDTTLTAGGFPINGDFGNAFMKLSTSSGLQVADYFEMSNTVFESGHDQDLGSGGALLLPDMIDATGKTRHLAMGAGKDTNIYLVDRDNMGKFSPSGNTNIYQELPGALPGGEWAMPAYFNNTLYYGGVSAPLKAWGFSQALLAPTPSSSTTESFGYPGTTPSISANDLNNAIVWAVENVGGAGVLHAYDAGNLTHELYNSSQTSNGTDNFQDNKFITPTIANGKIYVGTPNSVAVFGLKPGFTNVPGLASDIGVGADGSVWVTTSDGSIYKYDGSKFNPIPGWASRVAVDPSGNAWVVNGGGLIYRYTGSGFVNVPGLASDVGVGANGTVWVTNPIGLIYRYNGTSFQAIPGLASRIAVDPNGNAWVVNPVGLIYRYTGSSFVNVPGIASDIGSARTGRCGSPTQQDSYTTTMGLILTRWRDRRARSRSTR